MHKEKEEATEWLVGTALNGRTGNLGRDGMDTPPQSRNVSTHITHRNSYPNVGRFGSLYLREIARWGHIIAYPYYALSVYHC